MLLVVMVVVMVHVRRLAALTAPDIRAMPGALIEHAGAVQAVNLNDGRADGGRGCAIGTTQRRGLGDRREKADAQGASETGNELFHWV